MQPIAFVTPRTARYYTLGEPGPATRQIWFCLHAHEQPVTELAQLLVPLLTEGVLLILPEGLSRHQLPAQARPNGNVPALAPQTGATWFAPDSLLADLADLTTYLESLAADVLTAYPANTPLTVLGCGHGAAAACRWLATSARPYERLMLYNPLFPPEVDRRATLVALPERPVEIITSIDTSPTEVTANQDLLRDLHDVGLSACLRQLDNSPQGWRLAGIAGEC